VKVDDATGRIWIGSSASDAIYSYDAPYAIHRSCVRGSIAR
jgi:hypothetical protein